MVELINGFPAMRLASISILLQNLWTQLNGMDVIQ